MFKFGAEKPPGLALEPISKGNESGDGMGRKSCIKTGWFSSSGGRRYVIVSPNPGGCDDVISDVLAVANLMSSGLVAHRGVEVQRTGDVAR